MSETLSKRMQAECVSEGMAYIDEVIALETMLGAKKRETALWQQAWHNAKNRATELANSILEAPSYKPWGLAECSAWKDLAHRIIGDLGAQEEQGMVPPLTNWTDEPEGRAGDQGD